jgi:hypothetical protein
VESNRAFSIPGALLLLLLLLLTQQQCGEAGRAAGLTT